MNKVRCNCGKIFDVEPLTFGHITFRHSEPIKRLYICKCGKRYYQRPTYKYVFSTRDSFVSEDMPEDLQVIDL